VFRPADAEIAWALRVTEASQEAKGKGIGAFLVDGRMIDAPFIQRAETMLAVARRLGLLPPKTGSHS
jgi:citrate lyase beta subunit